jgi:hypothetical protein
MNPKRLQQDVTDVLSTAEGLINDMIISGPADSVKYYNRMIKKFYRVQALLLATPELVAAFRCTLRNINDRDAVTGDFSDYYGAEYIRANQSYIVQCDKALSGKVQA